MAHIRNTAAMAIMHWAMTEVMLCFLSMPP
jgi:hypothetical protein